jgi:hypothetical protein
MEVMIELNGSRVAAPRSQCGEFGMIAFKISDVADKTGGVPARREVRVTLRAVCVACGGKSNRSPMIGMAGNARGRKRLRCVMQGAVMARDALLVEDLFVVKTQIGCVAGGALLGENCVSG